MGSRSSAPAPSQSQIDDAVREHLDRVLASATFQQGDRLKRFLKFIVLEAMAGRRHELKEYVIGVQVFGKEETFDPRTDPIVRVQARRLRAKLVRYYREEGRADELVIELPKGGYAPVFKHRDTPVLIKRTVAAALVSRNTVAVLPFADHSGERDLEYFCRGMREEIVHHLTRLPSLRILASDEPRLTGDKTDAAMIIGGSVRRSGERLRITAQLVDGATGCYIWSESVDALVGELFAAQERVAAAIAARIEPELGERRPGGAARKPNENLAAHNLYLQGRYHLNQRTEEGLRKALEFFEKSLVEDAEYAAAHAGLSDAYQLVGDYGGFVP